MPHSPARPQEDMLRVGLVAVPRLTSLRRFVLSVAGPRESFPCTLLCLTIFLFGANWFRFGGCPREFGTLSHDYNP